MFTKKKNSPSEVSGGERHITFDDLHNSRTGRPVLYVPWNTVLSVHICSGDQRSSHTASITTWQVHAAGTRRAEPHSGSSTHGKKKKKKITGFVSLDRCCRTEPDDLFPWICNMHDRKCMIFFSFNAFLPNYLLKQSNSSLIIQTLCASLWYDYNLCHLLRATCTLCVFCAALLL